MAGSSLQLGDSHNFGRRVALRRGRVANPRTLLWEWLVLSAESPLRRLLDEAGERDGLGSRPFGFLPSLEFFRSRVGTFGEVEQIALEPLPRLSSAGKRALAAIV